MSSLIGTPVEFYDSDGTASGSVAVTVAAGNRRCLIAQVGTFGGSVTGVSSSVDGALTQVGTTASGADGETSQWRLTNPTVGAHTITVTCGGGTTEIAGVVSVWDDVNQTTPMQNATTSVVTPTSTPSLSVTVGGGNKGIGFCWWYTGGAAGATESDTLIHEKDASGAESGYSAQYDSAGSLSWTLSASGGTVASGAEIVHDGGSGAGAAASTLMLMGIGA